MKSRKYCYIILAPEEDFTAECTNLIATFLLDIPSNKQSSSELRLDCSIQYTCTKSMRALNTNGDPTLRRTNSFTIASVYKFP